MACFISPTPVLRTTAAHLVTAAGRGSSLACVLGRGKDKEGTKEEKVDDNDDVPTQAQLNVNTRPLTLWLTNGAMTPFSIFLRFLP
ncbi:hypothetical protein E2C01_032955 [Portunus trituberculatus]|uniref:Uncharacterized protein n=1 Tax=Portunus trituberculatus TaxID=210409 RepID=A0A5B7F2G3_PORTR|nr:hypothetical protein [Portunus trituberculatus]